MKFDFKKLKIKKSVLGIAAVVVLFAGAIWLNLSVNGASPSPSISPEPSVPDSSAEPVVANANYFESFRADREAVRGKEIEYLDAIIGDDATDAETLAQAQEQKLAIVASMEMEFTLESLIKAKGFEDVAVTYHEGSVNVFVDAEALSDEQVAQILDIVTTETGEGASSVKVACG